MTAFKRLNAYYARHTQRCNILLIASWLVINFLQAAFTELAHDEAYYWMYARQLDYGYFDHPPAIAVLIRAGSFLIDGELGVRLFIVPMGALLLWGTFRLTNRKHFPLFFLVFAALSSFEVYGFIAVPDAPLLLCTAGFFLLYRRYLEDDRFVNSALLSICVAALLYCKYHGLLVLFFTLVSHLSLLKRRSFYVVIALAVTCYLPHIVWQVVNDYPSYQYHVLTKSQDPYNPIDTLLFVAGQLLIAGPLIGIVLFYAAFRYKRTTLPEKAMQFTLWGFFGFFLLSTVNARVEPNWMSAALVPLVVLGYNYITENGRLRKAAIALATVSVVLFACMRVNFVLDLVPAAGSRLLPEFFGWRSWAQDIHRKAGNTPVVFANSYQKAAKYSFYTQQTSLSLNNVRYRRNQYDLWDIEDGLQGKRVLYVPNWDIGPEALSIRTEKENVQYLYIDNFRSYAKVAIHAPQKRFVFRAGETVHLPITLENRYPQPVRFNRNRDYPDKLVFCVFDQEEFDHQQEIRSLEGVVLDSTLCLNTVFRVPEKSGTYYVRIAVQNGWLPGTINSRLIRVTVE